MFLKNSTPRLDFYLYKIEKHAKNDIWPNEHFPHLYPNRISSLIPYIYSFLQTHIDLRDTKHADIDSLQISRLLQSAYQMT